MLIIKQIQNLDKFRGFALFKQCFFVKNIVDQRIVLLKIAKQGEM